ncbi:MAG: pilus assembly protein [Lachnospiraceae bacterium]|nr:pilus assembly protein [Lachnospiraceae bacterium]
MKTRMKKNYTLTGSLTVETALLMPVLFLVVFMCIYLTVHIHNRMWIGAYAAEQAVSGRVQPDPELLFSGKMTSERSESDRQRSVHISGETVYFNGQTLWSTDASAQYEICRPVPYLWRIKAARELIE